LGPLVFLILFYSVYHQVQQQNWQQSFSQIKSAVTGSQQWKIWMTIALMVANWGLEARKWQLCIRELEHVSFLKAFGAILAGTAIASFTPNRVGEYLGRMLYIEEGKRLQSISLSIICSISQVLVTMIAGIIGLFYLQKIPHARLFHDTHIGQIGRDIFFIGIGFSIILGAVIYFRLPAMVRFSEKMHWKKIFTQVRVLKDVKLTILFNILSLSFARYIVFILQYYLLFTLFGVAITWGQTFAGISIMFLLIAVVPTFTFLTDLGLRWEAGLQIIKLFNSNTTGIFAVTLGIWLINLIIPALIGSLLILRIKLFRS